jgi:histidyl-tRNA synthetase
MMETANKLGAEHVLIVGEDEIAAGQYTLKNMQSGDEAKLSREQILERFQCKKTA